MHSLNLSKCTLLPAATLAAFLLIFSLAAVRTAHAQITLDSSDANSAASYSGTEGASFSLTFSGSTGDTVLVAICGTYYFSGDPSVTATGGTLSLIDSYERTGYPYQIFEVYKLTASSSSGEVTVSFGHSSAAIGVAAAYSGTSGVDAWGTASDFNDPMIPDATVTTVAADDLVVGLLCSETIGPLDPAGTGFTYVNGQSLTFPSGDTGIFAECEDSNSQSYAADTEVKPTYEDDAAFWFEAAVALKPS